MQQLEVRHLLLGHELGVGVERAGHARRVKGWDVVEESMLGLFSFNKFVIDFLYDEAYV